MVSTIIVFRHPMEMEEELQNVGKVNTTGLFIWTFLIIQKKVLSVTVIGEKSNKIKTCFPQWGVPNRWLEFQADGIQ